MPDSSAPTNSPLVRAIEVIDSGLAVADLHGRWLDFNPAFAHRLDAPVPRLRQATALDCVEPADRAAFAAAFTACCNRGVTADFVCRWPSPDGAQACRTRIVRLPAIDGDAGAVLVQIDAGDPAIDASHARALQLFADRISHDLRAPLRSIESFSTLLARRAGDRLDGTDTDHLARIRAAAARMGALLDALGEYARAMHAALRTAPVDLSLLAEWVCADLHEADPGREAALRVQPGLFVHGDERLLRSMLEQLLRNAWQFSQGRECVHIELDGERRGDRLHVRVRDRGCGFDMQYAHRLFEPFQRLHGREHGGGHGLGLAIAHCIVQRHGGSIRADSQPGTGSEFTLELPAALDADKER